MPRSPTPSLLARLALMALLASGCPSGFADPTREFGPPVPDGREGKVTVHVPPTMGSLDTPLRDVNGVPIGIACETCHGPDAIGEVLAEARANPEGMHASVELRHGPLTCASCHAPDDRRYLRLADGTMLPRADAIELCHQCHGPQFRDYTNGSHGGMTGAWDLRRGDRERNHCLDCHGAHAPAFPTLSPVFPPRDRGFVQAHGAGEQG